MVSAITLLSNTSSLPKSVSQDCTSVRRFSKILIALLANALYSGERIRCTNPDECATYYAIPALKRALFWFSVSRATGCEEGTQHRDC